MKILKAIFIFGKQLRQTNGLHRKKVCAEFLPNGQFSRIRFSQHGKFNLGGFMSQMRLLGLGLLIWLKMRFDVSKLNLVSGLLFSSFSAKLIYSSVIGFKICFLADVSD